MDGFFRKQTTNRTVTAPAASLAQAVEALRRGGLIAYPTEAVFGLGCDPRNESAVRRLLALKRRDPGKGLILVAATLEQLEPWLLPLAEPLRGQVLASWPGPVTWLLPAAPQVPGWLRGEHDTLAVRVSAHPVIRDLCLALDAPIISTSANLTGQMPARDIQTVAARFADRLDYLLDGALGGLAHPSEIRDGRSGAIVRPG